MTNWRCPHCGAPQREAAHCWVCGRPTTSCSSCRHFRRSVAVAVGYCALDLGRAPLTGDEVRPCWQPLPVIALPGGDEDLFTTPAPR